MSCSVESKMPLFVEETVLNCPDNEFLFGFYSEFVVNLVKDVTNGEMAVAKGVPNLRMRISKGE